MNKASSAHDLRSIWLMLAIGATCIIVLVGGLGLGTRPIAPPSLLSAIFHPDDRIDSILVWTLRLPRSLAALLAGAGLGLSGFLLQTLTRNPLAGPGLTGVTAGCITPIVLCFVLVPWLSSVYYPLIGMVGGLVAALTTVWIAQGGTGRPMHLALGGMSVSLFLSAITTWTILWSGPQVPSLLFWLSGGFQGRTWLQLAYMTPWVTIAMIVSLACWRAIGLMTLGEQAAAGMGLNLTLWRPALLFLAVLPVAGIAPVAGPIAFVGMAAPHIARLLKPSGPAAAIMLSCVIGSLMVVAADVVARSLAPPRELPVSIITALLAGPIFIWIVQRRTFGGVGK